MPASLASAHRRLALLALTLLTSAGAAGCLGQDLTTPRAARMVVEGGSAQTVAPLERVATPLSVRVFDQYLNVLPGQIVTWRVESGGGSVSDATTTTNSNGIAETYYTAGSATGTAFISATLAGLGSLTLTVTIAAPSGS